MKKICFLISFVLLIINSKAQVVLYTDSFNNGSSSGWQLDAGGNFDTWIVNNIYNCSDPTPDQGGNYYMHVYDDLTPDDCDVGVFDGLGSSGLVYATMTTGLSTLGQSSVSIKFDWLCNGQTGSVLPSYGTVDYSINGGSTWTNITHPISKYNGQSTWTTTTITSTQVPAILNQADLRLRFGFTNSGYGINPAFGVDNIVVSGGISTALSHVLYMEDTHISIYPNPAQDNLYMLNENLKGKGFLNVYNMLGEMLISVPYSSAESTGETCINVKKLASGLYFMQFQCKKGNLIQKFMKE